MNQITDNVDTHYRADLRELAALVLSTLDLQRRYFEERRKNLPSCGKTLDDCKRAERALRVRANECQGEIPGGLF